VAPILVAAPLYFSGKISFGGLMQAAAAFTQAQSSLRWFVDNFSIIADWRATLQRVASFRYALSTTEDMSELESRITYVEGEPGTITINDLEIVSPSGSDMLKETQVVIKAGERVLIVGAPAPVRHFFSARWRGCGPGAAAASRGLKTKKCCICRPELPICRAAPSRKCWRTRWKWIDSPRQAHALAQPAGPRPARAASG